MKGPLFHESAKGDGDNVFTSSSEGVSSAKSISLSMTSSGAEFSETPPPPSKLTPPSFAPTSCPAPPTSSSAKPTPPGYSDGSPPLLRPRELEKKIIPPPVGGGQLDRRGSVGTWIAMDFRSRFLQAISSGDGLRGRLDVGGIGLGVGAGLIRPAGRGQWEQPAGRMLGAGQPVGGGFL
ncbi:hypothetical protein FH972_008045 [Carpinus fangiana]|uniref:Uncharacterized protein n=1 Tax=Carpinus fangiana TaxID=176857 RepID=A0A5N6QYA4_9ROSI|nr:hypothetical protein FH972_008045 [Carpinus fangiana]